MVEEEPSGRTTGMGEHGEMGMLFFDTKFLPITFPSAPPSIKIRAGWPLTEPINVSNCFSASAVVNACRRIVRCRCRLACRLVKRAGAIVTKEEDGSRTTSSDELRTTGECGKWFSSRAGARSVVG